MSKKMMLAISIAVAMFSSISTAKAAPMYYTFTGKVSSIQNTGGQVQSQYGSAFMVGSAATLHILDRYASTRDTDDEQWKYTDADR